jgi:hypothetical protein
VIHDLDRSVAELLRRELPPDLVEQVQISFAAPDDQFPPPAVTLPAVDLFLYDVRENMDLRRPDPIIERAVDGTRRKRPPVRMDCSYLITAWPSDSSTDRAQDEHRMLGSVISALLRHPTLPAAVLQGTLRDQEPPLPASSLHPGRLQSLAEFWQALGGKPKAALNYTVTIGVDAFEAVETGPPVRDKVIGLTRLGEDA